MKIKRKKLHKSWKEKAEFEFTSKVNKEYWLEGVDAFRNRALDALEVFTITTADEPIIHKKKVYVSLEDVAYLINGLYSDIKDVKK
jgi:hypothetical protein